MASGVVAGAQRATAAPEASTRNFVKFQEMSGLGPSPGCAALIHW